MSGVRQGDRLQRLRDLERQVKVQIELEELAARRDRALFDPCAAYPATDPAPATDIDPQSQERTTLVRVPIEAVASPVIREWARRNRYDVPIRGRLDLLVVGAFAEAHK